ncbi:MAG: type II toxin-antitoxin system HicB family antitoxin [Anaerolineae bacterium]
MLTDYIRAAMEHAHHEILEDGTYYGEIPDCPGVYANAETLERCRDQLREVLEDWIVLSLRMGHTFPVINGISLGGEVEVT